MSYLGNGVWNGWSAKRYSTKNRRKNTVLVEVFTFHNGLCDRWKVKEVAFSRNGRKDIVQHIYNIPRRGIACARYVEAMKMEKC